MNTNATEQARHAKLIHDAIKRGQVAFSHGDRAEAIRWLDRARRLAPRDGTIMLLMASHLLGYDNPRAEALFGEVLASHQVRDAWLGLATARVLSGNVAAAADALVAVLSRYAFRPDVAPVADKVARAVGASGWCGLASDGTVIARTFTSTAVAATIDGNHIDGLTLPGHWPRALLAAAQVGDRDLFGSPISLRAIGRVEGRVEPTEDGLRGWAWCPGDPDADPGLIVESGRIRFEVVASEPAEVVGLAPLARPRSFVIRKDDLPRSGAHIHLRGRDGRELPIGALGKPLGSRGAVLRPHPVARRAAVGTVILVTHSDGGGVERCVQTSIAAHKASGRRAIILRPVKPDDGVPAIALDDGSEPQRRFEMPGEHAALIRILRRFRPIEIEFHHFLQHDPSIFQIARELNVPYEAHTHDYAWFCPRIALVGRADRYCGEPAVRECEHCVAELGPLLKEDIPVAALIDRSREFLLGARRVVAPSHDAAERMRTHFTGIAPVAIAHEDDRAVAEPPPIPRITGTVRVCVGGAIGLHKGFHVLLACARDAARRSLDLDFVVAGTTIDDQSLIDTGRVFVTGPYSVDEAVPLIRAQAASFAFLPSIWPETWCFGLTELWRAGLRVVAFDIGAPAERIRGTGRGFLLPLGLPAAEVNDAFLHVARGRSLLPI